MVTSSHCQLKYTPSWEFITEADRDLETWVQVMSWLQIPLSSSSEVIYKLVENTGYSVLCVYKSMCVFTYLLLVLSLMQPLALFTLSKWFNLTVTESAKWTGLDPCFLTRKPEHLSLSEDSFVCHSWRGCATGMEGIEARDIAKCPTMHRTAPTKWTWLIQDKMSLVPR